MMGEKELCLMILAVNTVVSLVYFLFVWIKEKDPGKACIGGLTILVTVGFGGIFLTLSSCYYHLISKHFEKQVKLDELSFSKVKAKNQVVEDVREARDKMPLEEVVRVSNKQAARKWFLGVLKSDYKKYVRTINEAVSSPDSEISHYAATAIIDTISKFKSDFEEDALKTENREQFIADTVDFLNLGILSKDDTAFYIQRLEQIAAELPLTDFLIYQMADVHITQKQYRAAGEWVQRVGSLDAKTLYTYKIQLKYFYETQNQTLFLQTIDQLKKSDIALDQQTLELVRMYMRNTAKTGENDNVAKHLHHDQHVSELSDPDPADPLVSL